MPPAPHPMRQVPFLCSSETWGMSGSQGSGMAEVSGACPFTEGAPAQPESNNKLSEGQALRGTSPISGSAVARGRQMLHFPRERQRAGAATHCLTTTHAEKGEAQEEGASEDSPGERATPSSSELSFKALSRCRGA